METVTNATIAALGAAVATTLPPYTGNNLEPVNEVTTMQAASTCDIKNCFTNLNTKQNSTPDLTFICKDTSSGDL